MYNLQDWLVEQYRQLDEQIEAMERPRKPESQTISGILSILIQFSQPAIYSFLAWHSQTSDISLADLHLIENTTSGLINTADAAYRTQEFSQDRLESLVNYYKALELKPALPRVENPIIYDGKQEVGMKIEFRNVSFRYNDDSPLVLDDISFVIDAGQVAALVGYNGSGKSTLIALLARAYDPTNGTIFINGQDLREYDRDSLSRHMSFTHQDFARWPLTGLENIAVGDMEHYSEMSAKDAARATGAYEVLDANVLAEDQTTTVSSSYHSHATGEAAESKNVKLWDSRLSRMSSEMVAAQSNHGRYRAGGVELSGGQWAKVALARSFLRKGDLLVLDEPSASLDPQAEHKLFTNLLKIRAGRTILFITHRLGVVRASDHILFLDHGRLVEQGTHEVLMQRENSLYRNSVQLQNEGFHRE